MSVICWHGCAGHREMIIGFASGPITFRRFFLCGERPDSLSNGWYEAIAVRAFGKQREAASDGIETGWIVPNHLFDVDFSSPDRVTCGRFVFLAMRLDRTAAPGAIIQSYRKMEESAALQASGRASLSRTERRLANEAALARAEEEARADKFRRTTAYPVLIDFPDGVVYFGNLGAPAGDKLMALFSETFGTPIVPATVDEVAYRIAQRQGRVRVFEDVQPAHLVEPPTPAGEADALTFPGQDRRFLGREFLAWLWHRVDAHEGLFEMKRHRSVTVAIERIMHLVCSFDLTGSKECREKGRGFLPFRPTPAAFRDRATPPAPGPMEQAVSAPPFAEHRCSYADHIGALFNRHPIGIGHAH